MAQQQKNVGDIAWADLTVPDADHIRDFYADVVGWTVTPVDMGGYSDYCMNAPETGDTVTGVCFARGTNADLPPVWLMYVLVEDLDRSIERCTSLGGRVVSGPKDMGPHGRYCVIADPAGAMLSLYQRAET